MPKLMGVGDEAGVQNWASFGGASNSKAFLQLVAARFESLIEGISLGLLITSDVVVRLGFELVEGLEIDVSLGIQKLGREGLISLIQRSSTRVHGCRGRLGAAPLGNKLLSLNHILLDHARIFLDLSLPECLSNKVTRSSLVRKSRQEWEAQVGTPWRGNGELQGSSVETADLLGVRERRKQLLNRVLHHFEELYQLKLAHRHG